MDNCIFCMIANGQIPAAALYEDDEFKVILDAGPASRGHALVIPKEHFANLFEIREELAAKAFVIAKGLLPAMKEALGCDGFQLVQNNGAAAGQSVEHFHLHIIPCYKESGMVASWTPGEASDEEKESIVSAVKKALE